MAKIVVYTMAYRGDVFPYVPIASELSRRGHDVTFVGPEELRPQLAVEPFAFRDGDCGDLPPTRLDTYGDYVRRWGRVLSGGMLLRLYFGRLVVPRLPQLYRAIDDALDGVPAAPRRGQTGSALWRSGPNMKSMSRSLA